MTSVVSESRKAAAGDQPVDAHSYARAILNILEDAEREKTQSATTQRAILNILEDYAGERLRLDVAQRALLNILDDAAGEKIHLEATQKAILNILDDAAEEKAHLTGTQRAIINILEDVATERIRLGETQRAILNILHDSAEEKERLVDTQRAALNVLDDFDAEKKKADLINVDLRKEIAGRVRIEEALRHAKAVAEAASKELEAFSYSVAHDLRAPLRSVDGFSQALLEDYTDLLDDDGKRYLNHVRDAACQMGELIDDLLDLARVGRAEFRRETVDLSAVAREVLARLRESQPDRDVEAIVEDGLVVSTDRRLLDVVLVNLLGNAWKFTGKRHCAHIEFGAKTDEKPATFFVRDDGAGFNPAYSAKLFGVFQRLHDSEDFEGTGIGLATVQRIIQRHGGRIWAESEVERGATFWFTLEEEGQP